MAVYIVKTENGFEAVQYESYKTPSSFVFKVLEGNESHSANHFFMVESGVTVSWNNYYGTPKWRMLEVKYEGITLFEKNDEKNVQVIIDILNKFKNISKEDLKELVQQVQEKQKTELELAIEALQQEKASLETQIKIYKEIQTKKEEIKELLSKIE